MVAGPALSLMPTCVRKMTWVWTATGEPLQCQNAVMSILPAVPADLRWIAIVPIKGGPLAKSRLGSPACVSEGGRRAATREALARAFAKDTVAALVAAEPVAEVLVVTSCDQVARDLRTPGVRIVAEDAGEGTDPDEAAVAADPLNRAIRQADRLASRSFPHHGVVVVTADLPTLDPEALRRLLSEAAAHRRAVLPDAEGTGTAMLMATPEATVPTPGGGRAPLIPRFGVDSRAAHEALGHVVLDAPRSLRRDIDTLADLQEAVMLGLGPHSTRVLASCLPPEVLGAPR